MRNISGIFLTKVFEGPYKDMGKWIKENEQYVNLKGKKTINYTSITPLAPNAQKIWQKLYSASV